MYVKVYCILIGMTTTYSSEQKDGPLFVFSCLELPPLY